MNAILTHPCGCSIRIINEVDAELRYCPLHAAAPLMLEACKLVLAWGIQDDELNTAECDRIQELLEAAIAAAQPEEVK